MFRITIADAKGILAKHLIQSKTYSVTQHGGFLRVDNTEGVEHNYALKTVAYYSIDSVADTVEPTGFVEWPKCNCSYRCDRCKQTSAK